MSFVFSPKAKVRVRSAHQGCIGSIFAAGTPSLTSSRFSRARPSGDSSGDRVSPRGRLPCMLMMPNRRSVVSGPGLSGLSNQMSSAWARAASKAGVRQPPSSGALGEEPNRVISAP